MMATDASNNFWRQNIYHNNHPVFWYKRSGNILYSVLLCCHVVVVVVLYAQISSNGPSLYHNLYLYLVQYRQRRKDF